MTDPQPPMQRPDKVRPSILRRLSGRSAEPAPADAVVQDTASRDITVGIGITAVFLLALLGWGLFARLDAAVVAPGLITVLGNRQSVQHRDGGIVSDLAVREGDRVTAGQVLLKLNTAELSANVKASADQVIQLRAMQARLLAELSGDAQVRFPADFAVAPEDERPFVAAAELLQRREFETRRAAMLTSKQVLGQRERELAEQIRGYRGQLVAKKEQQGLITQEIDSLKRLQELGLVPATRMRSLQRSRSDLTGSEGEYTATVARTEQEIGETRIRISDLERERAADNSKEYRGAEFQLAELQPKLAAMREQLSRSIVRAPASGRVVGLTIFTIGGVITPGQKLMDVVPENQPLVIEARVKPNDVTDLTVGRKTEIRITAFHDRQMPKLNGVVSKVSADAFVDEKAGISYFRAEVTVPASELEIIAKRRGPVTGLQPGLPVEVLIPLRRRNALEYLLEPLQRSLWVSFREH